MGKKIRCKFGFHSYEKTEKDLVKTCIFCGSKYDPRHGHGGGDGGSMDGGC